MSSDSGARSRRVFVLAAIAVVAVVGAAAWWSQPEPSPSGPPLTAGSKPQIVGRVTPKAVTVNGKPVSGPPPVSLTRVKGANGEEGFVPHFTNPPVAGEKTVITLPDGGKIEMTPLEGAPPAPRPASK